MKHLLLTTIAAVVLVGCGKPSIHEAAWEGNIAAVKQHLAAGSDVNLKDENGTPLHLAAIMGHKEIVELLIAAGADVNAKTDFGFTPLNYAVVDGRKVIVELLIAKGADVNAKDDVYGRTPLHRAAYKGYKELAELFLAKGADVNAKNAGGDTPLDLGISNDETETADLLRKHGGKTGEELEAEGK